MRVETVKRNLYSFGELSEEAKEKAIERLYDLNVDHDWWDSVYEDAERVGLKITSFDLDRGSYVKGKFTQSAEAVANAILQEHGPNADTVETAQQYIFELEHLRDPYSDENRGNDDFDPDDIDTEEIDKEFLRMLCEDYRIMLQEEYDYLTSEEAIIETIQANEYEFTEDGKLA